MPEPSAHLTELLRAWARGDERALGKVIELAYPELRQIARRCLRMERSEHTVQATALVHEAYLRLIDTQKLTWQDRAHFFALAAGIMRRILIDHARARGSAKRGGGMESTKTGWAGRYRPNYPLMSLYYANVNNGATQYGILYLMRAATAETRRGTCSASAD